MIDPQPVTALRGVGERARRAAARTRRARPRRICCSCCPCATRIAPASCRWGNCARAARGGRGRGACSPKSRFAAGASCCAGSATARDSLTLRFFLFHRAAAARAWRAARASAASARCAAGRRAWRWCIRNIGASIAQHGGRRRAPDADLSRHRGHHPGAAAPAGAAGAGADQRAARSRIGCRPPMLADSRLPTLARSAAVRAPAAGGCAGGSLARLAPPGAAAARVRGAAGAPALAQAAAAAHPAGSGLAACRRRRR